MGGSERWNRDVRERQSADGFCAPCTVTQEGDKWQDLRGTVRAKAGKGCRARAQGEGWWVVSGKERGLVGLR